MNSDDNSKQLDNSELDSNLRTGIVSNLMSKGIESASHLYGDISSRAVKAREEIKPRIAAVNEKFVAKACQLWAKLHSDPVQVPFQELQNQLMTLYKEVLAGSADEIKRTLKDSEGETLRIRVRRVSDVAVLVSSKHIHALIDFAEQKINLLLPVNDTSIECQSDKVMRSTEAVIEKHVPEGLSKRLIILPLTISYRICRQVNIFGINYASVLMTNSKNHIEDLVLKMNNNLPVEDLRKKFYQANDFLMRLKIEVNQIMSEKKNFVVDMYVDRKEFIRNYFNYVYQFYMNEINNVMGKAKSIKQNGEQYIQKAKDTINDKKEFAKNTIDNVKHKAYDKVNDAKTNAYNKVNDIKLNAFNKVNDVKMNAVNKVNTVKSTVGSVRDLAVQEVKNRKTNLQNQVIDQIKKKSSIVVDKLPYSIKEKAERTIQFATNWIQPTSYAS